MKTDKEKAEEIKKKRELAAKGLKERKDGKPIDPLKAALEPQTLDNDPDQPKDPEEKEQELVNRGLALGLGLNRR